MRRQLLYWSSKHNRFQLAGLKCSTEDNQLNWQSHKLLNLSTSILREPSTNTTTNHLAQIITVVRPFLQLHTLHIFLLHKKIKPLVKKSDGLLMFHGCTHHSHFIRVRQMKRHDLTRHQHNTELTVGRQHNLCSLLEKSPAMNIFKVLTQILVQQIVYRSKTRQSD